MNTQILRDKDGRKKGELREQQEFIRAYNKDGKYMGYFNSHTNKTYNANGSPIGTGNQTAALL